MLKDSTAQEFSRIGRGAGSRLVGRRIEPKPNEGLGVNPKALRAFSQGPYVLSATDVHGGPSIALHVRNAE